ncbi:beta-galactosidase [Deinococcus pimensis]|uniref:beta-galactosidase n=1 Tax=Deinococcus pimensis TaxID=309888 RepID=UPI000485410F|nr:beta-galactosidase [Deinococcus pimensis]
MRLGVCDYPEHVSRETWLTYPAMMKTLGLEVVRLAEFAWARFEPRPGEFDFDWLDEAVDALHAEGLGVVLGTPTATPPNWLTHERPELLLVDEQGRRRRPGSRRHYDYASPDWWDETRRVVEVVARRYGAHPAVIGWQTDNEHGCHDTVRSYSDHARRAFQRWLAAKYGTVDALNDAWGAVFWSQTYTRFDEVDLPNLTVYTPNPSHLLDFHRYSSDQVVAYDRMQTEILRAHSPGRFVTHNFMVLFEQFDHYDACAHLDFPSFDTYPTAFLDVSWLSADLKRTYARTGHPDLAGFAHDFYRGVKPGAAHWVMEQQAGHADWAAHNTLPADGAVNLWTMQAHAHGADAVVYFRWRAATAGAELMHSGLLRHDGKPDRGYHEVRDVAPLVKAAPGGRVPARVALLHDFDSLWAYDAQKHARSASYWAQLMGFYTALREQGVDVDVRHPLADLSSYDALVAPCLHVLSEETAAHLRTQVERGARLLLGPRTGFRRESGRVWEDGAPGPLAPLAGVRVRNFDALAPGTTVGVTAGGGETHLARTWTEDLEPQVDDVEVLARYTEGPLRGRAAVTRRAHGAGGVTCIGAWSETLLRRVTSGVLSAAGVEHAPLPEGVRVSRRGERQYTQDWRYATVVVENLAAPLETRP